MSKQVTDTGEMWVDSEVPSKLKMGFTHAFLEKHQSECWHIIPQNGKIRKGMVLLSLETNDGLVSVKSPYDGVLVTFSDTAVNFPEKLTDEIAIAEFRPEEPKEKTATDYLKKPTTKRAIDPNTVWPGIAENVFVGAQGARRTAQTRRPTRQEADAARNAFLNPAPPTPRPNPDRIDERIRQWRLEAEQERARIQQAGPLEGNW